VSPASTEASDDSPFIAPEVTSQLLRENRARVLVELRVPGALDASHREASIQQAQNAVLSRLPGNHALLVRRYASVPLLALDIDATALSALRGIPEVLAVKADQVLHPQR
jgi:hypothetical protein